MDGKKLIINADDFGICESTNRAIKELFLAKKITSCSLLAGAMASKEALAIAREERFKVGCHLALNSDFKELPWQGLDKNKASSLLDPNGNLFYDTNIIAKKAKSRDVTAECLAQIQTILDEGVELDHIDNHSGTMYGLNKRLFFIIAFRLAKKYNLPFRFPEQNDFLKSVFDKGIPVIVKVLHKAVVGVSKIMGARIIDNIITNPYSIDKISSYKDLENYYINALHKLKAGTTTELFLHPSYHSPTLSPLTKEWKKREYELEFLTSPALENFIKEEGIELVTYSSV